MNTNHILNVTSEIGKLKTVMLHRPDKELENLVPDMMEDLLFDDIPYLKVAQREHDVFANILKDNGVEVVYLEDLASEAISNSEVRNEFVQEFLSESIIGDGIQRALIEYFKGLDNKKLINKMMSGVRKKDLTNYRKVTLVDMVSSKYSFLIYPMPNLYFTRDPSAVIGTGITINRMRADTRNRETIFAKYIFKHHPRFKNKNIPIWFNRNEKTSLEGGDKLVLSDKLIAVGISHRTDAESIEKFAKKILNDDSQSFERILAFDIPKKRAFMHLDTVFTMVDYDKFTIHPEIESPLTVFSITKKKDKHNCLDIKKEEAKLDEILRRYLELDKVKLIRCAGGDPVDAAREQWNDGSNTLAIAPGEVVVYSRNSVTNKILNECGIKTHVMPSSELSRGRGGPRCMSMPLVREKI